MSIGTPDYTRGVASAQKLLATVPAGTANVTVGVPPNAETLIVVAADIADTGTIYAEGTSTLYKYAGVRLPTQPHMTTATTWIFDVSNTMDEQVEVVFADAPGEIWFVYADSAAHVVGDASALKSTLGQAYAIPSAPSTVAGDHPPVDLSKAAFAATTDGGVIAAPGAGKRLRVFTVEMAAAGGSGGGTLFARCYDTAGPYIGLLAFGGGGYPAGRSFTQYPLTGLALSNNGGVDLAYDTGSGTLIRGIITYIEETI